MESLPLPQRRLLREQSISAAGQMQQVIEGVLCNSDRRAYRPRFLARTVRPHTDPSGSSTPRTHPAYAYMAYARDARGGPPDAIGDATCRPYRSRRR